MAPELSQSVDGAVALGLTRVNQCNSQLTEGWLLTSVGSIEDPLTAQAFIIRIVTRLGTDCLDIIRAAFRTENFTSGWR